MVELILTSVGGTLVLCTKSGLIFSKDGYMDVDAVQESDAVAADSKTSQQAFAFVQKVAAELSAGKELELPGFPEVVVKLQKALGDENGSLKEVSRIINSEPALAARLMQLANSAAFRQTTDPVGDLRTAVTMLGLNVVRATATNFAMQQMQQQEWLKPLSPELRKIWKSSNKVAATAYTVAKQLEAMQPDKAMLAGLFHQLGRLYLLTMAHRDDTGLIHDPAWSSIVNDWHPTITRAILDSWGLPEDVTYATESQDAVSDGQTGNLDRLSLVVSASKYYADQDQSGDMLAAEALLGEVNFSGTSFSEIVTSHRDEIDQMITAIS
jgi:HD-like signal output (HDOD) protein